MRAVLVFLIACGSSEPAPDAPLDAESLPPRLVKQPSPVLGGPDEIASDPAVHRVGDQLVMTYTCLPDGQHTAICEAHSTDGLAWTKVPSRVAGLPEGTILVATAPDTSVEGSEHVQLAGAAVVFASTYGHAETPAPGYPAALIRAAAARSTVLPPLADTADCDAVYSPTIRDDAGTLEMIYVGHCFADPQPAESTAGLALRRATSSDGGASWTRTGRAVVPGSQPWAVAGVAEPSWIDGRDRDRLLVSGGFGEGERQVIGFAARAAGGELQLRETLLLEADGDECAVLAPSALIEDGTLRVWYLAPSGPDCASLAIRYAEGPAAVLDLP